MKSTSINSPGDKKNTILVIDDNVTNIAVVTDYLTESGYRVLSATDGQRGIDRVGLARPDLILLDVMMPGIDGFEVCRRLKFDLETAEIPVIFMTALAETSHIIEGFELGAVDYITKPIQREEMLARIATHLNLSSMTQSLLHTTNQLELVSQIGNQITSILDVDELLSQIVNLLQSSFRNYLFDIYLLNDAGQKLEKVGSSDESGAPPHSIALDADNVIAIATRTAALTTIDSLSRPISWHPDSIVFKLPKQITAPVKMNEQKFGALKMQSTDSSGLNQDDVRLLRLLADQVAVAVNNARLFAQNKQRTAELTRAKIAAEAADQTKSHFLTNMSHELRTPLTSIRGALMLLKEGIVGEVPDEARNLLDIGYNNTEKLLLLINDILDIQKIESGKLRLNLETFQLMPFLEQVVNEHVGYTGEQDVRIIIKQGVEQSTLYADKARITQVVGNLLSNAAKYSGAGSTVEIAVVQLKNGGLRVSVKDSGSGIPDTFKGNIFKRFSQSDSSDARHKGGTGLGLAISRAIIESHGGELDYVSEQGVGSTFYFDLPESASVKTHVGEAPF